MTTPALQRLAILVGESGIVHLAQLRVAVFGVGGVGSWAAEALARSGVGHITLVDSDTVCVSNINRQLPADFTTVGQPKVEVMATRLRHINPQAEIQAIQAFYHAENHESFALSSYDYVLDAIDSVPSKVHLLHTASSLGAVVFSSMGAANKFDLTQIRSGSIWKTSVCPLAKKVRYELRQAQFSGDLQCVYSTEATAPKLVPSEFNGTLAPVTASFGLHLASLLLNHALKDEVRACDKRYGE